MGWTATIERPANSTPPWPAGQSQKHKMLWLRLGGGRYMLCAWPLTDQRRPTLIRDRSALFSAAPRGGRIHIVSGFIHPAAGLVHGAWAGCARRRGDGRPGPSRTHVLFGSPSPSASSAAAGPATSGLASGGEVPGNCRACGSTGRARRASGPTPARPSRGNYWPRSARNRVRGVGAWPYMRTPER